MAGLDADSFRFSPLPPPKPFSIRTPKTADKENSNPNRSVLVKGPLDRFESICPPGEENKLVLYTTSLRGVRKTLEACNAVRAAMENLSVMVCERDVSMDRGFREELNDLMEGKGRDAAVPPRLFVKGRYVGGSEEVLKIVEEGLLGEILEGLPRSGPGRFAKGAEKRNSYRVFSAMGVRRWCWWWGRGREAAARWS